MYIERLRIENWKNFLKGDVKLTRRLFLLGPNASGKSNFLDALRFLRDLCVPKGGGLRQAIELRGGVSTIRCLAARKHSDIVIHVYLREESGKDGLWEYLLQFNQDNLQKPLIRKERVLHNGEILLNRPDPLDENDAPRLTQTALEQITANRDFRPIGSFLQSISYQHLLPQIIRDPQGFSPKEIQNDPYGRDFLQRVENTTRKIRDSRLRKIQQALSVAAPQLKELKVDRDKYGAPHLIGLFEHWRPQAGNQNESQFSDGTLRLFGLLWTMFEGEGPLLMEEPELSLHLEVVRRLPQVIERINRARKIRRQVIISTHSEALLSDAGIGPEEVLRLEPSPNGTQLISPLDSPNDVAQFEAGLTAADIVLPQSAAKSIQQLEFSF